MSLESWKEEFYPTPASRATKDDALAHSRKKWSGLTQANWSRHFPGKPTSPFLLVDHTSCALCFWHLRYEGGERNCESCPLAQSRGGVPCDTRKPSEHISPWSEWSGHANPHPMIEALTRAENILNSRELFPTASV